MSVRPEVFFPPSAAQRSLPPRVHLSAARLPFSSIVTEFFGRPVAYPFTLLPQYDPLYISIKNHRQEASRRECAQSVTPGLTPELFFGFLDFCSIMNNLASQMLRKPQSTSTRLRRL